MLGFGSIIAGDLAARDRAGVAWSGSALVSQAIKSARKKADFLIVTFHWGDEKSALPNEKQKRLARAAIDSGADVVFGHHPHCTQTMEQYKKGIIFYSLGEFVFYRTSRKHELAKLVIEKTGSEIKMGYAIVPVKIINGRPMIGMEPVISTLLPVR